MAEQLLVVPRTFQRDADKRLFLALRNRLLDYEPFRASRPAVELDVSQGTVRVAGRVRTLAMKEIVGYLCQRTDGVVAVRNELVSDTEVVRRVADALAADPELAPLCIKIESRAGLATLHGDLPRPELESKAIEVARAAPGVVEVASELVVRPLEAPPTAPPKGSEQPGPARTQDKAPSPEGEGQPDKPEP